MYTTTKQIHVAIDILYQQLASNRKRSYQPEEIDHIYNMTLLEYISTRSNPKTNIKHEGRETTVKRVEDLRELKARKLLPVYIDSSKLQYAILPNNYREYKDVVANVIYGCKGLPNLNNYKYTEIKDICVLPFINTNVVGEHFKNFKIELNLITGGSETLFNVSDYGDFVGFYSNDVKFEIINLLLDSVVLNKKKPEVYWENYGNEYEQSSFILVVQPDIYSSATISYDNISTTVQFIPKDYERYNKSSLENVESLTSSSELIDSESIGDILRNSMMIKNRQENPLIELEENRILIHHDNKFIVDSITLRYDKKPIFMNYKANILPSLLDRANEIIPLVVSNMAITTSGNIEGLLQKSQITE